MSDGFNVVADWSGTLNGNGALEAVIEAMAHLVCADVAILSRRIKTQEKIRYVARFDAQAGKYLTAPPRSVSARVLGEHSFSAKPGSVWKLSEVRETEQRPKSIFNSPEAAPDHYGEVVVIALATENGQADFVEFHFAKTPAPHNLDLLQMLSETLSSSWRRRLPGIITKHLDRDRLRAVVPASGAEETAILDYQNPAALSRCEFRICALLKEGMTVNLIAQSLTVGQATVRSHLSSIFAKTGTSNQVELLHRLNAAPPESQARLA